MTSRVPHVIHHVRRLAPDGEFAPLSDRQLLTRYAARREPAAFAALAARHGPLVWQACRRLLSDPADVEDAFQATFLVLVRKAGSLANPDALAAWLYAVADRTARDIPHERFRASGLVAVAEGQTEAGDHAAARKSLAAAERLVEGLDADDPVGGKRKAVWLDVALVQVKAGDIPGAWKTARSLEPFQKAVVMGAVAEAKAAAGDGTRALADLRAVARPVRDTACVGVAQAAARAGDLMTALEAIGSVESPVVRAMAYSDVGRAFARRGNGPAAAEVFGHGWKAIDRAGLDNPSGEERGRDGAAEALAALARTQAEAGQAATVRAWAARQASAYAKAWALVGLAEGLALRPEAPKAGPPARDGGSADGPGGGADRTGQEPTGDEHPAPDVDDERQGRPRPRGDQPPGRERRQGRQ